MQINEICKETGLTKKAVEYYQQKGLVSPKVNENGYREFSDSDLFSLKEIALLRKLDLTTDEIGKVLSSSNKKQSLASIKDRKKLEAKAKLRRLELMEELVNGAALKDIQDRLNLLEQQLTIKEKLLLAFPGYYGRYVSIHFGQFLNEPIKTEEQKLLYDRIVDFLDNMKPLEIPEELQWILEEADKDMSDEKIRDMNANVQSAYDDFDAYFENNKEAIVKYAEFKKSEEYQSSIIPQLMELFRKFGETSGYYEVFIPSMRKLSPAYDDYYKKILEANEKLMKKMPDVQD